MYIAFRRVHRYLEGRPNTTNTRRNAFVLAHRKPILWDVYIERGKSELEWNRSKPLSTAVLDTMPTIPRTQNHGQGLTKEEEERLRVSAIVVLPSQRIREPGYVDGEGLENWAIGITAIRCKGFTPST